MCQETTVSGTVSYYSAWGLPPPPTPPHTAAAQQHWTVSNLLGLRRGEIDDSDGHRVTERGYNSWCLNSMTRGVECIRLLWYGTDASYGFYTIFFLALTLLVDGLVDPKVVNHCFGRCVGGHKGKRKPFQSGFLFSECVCVFSTLSSGCNHITIYCCMYCM